MTRWHEMDLAGYLLNEHTDNWEEIRLPAIAEEDDPLGRKVGEALCPERYDEEDLAQFQAAVGPHKWNSLYQQRPMALEGNLFKAEMFELAPPPGQFDYTFVMGDTAYTDSRYGYDRWEHIHEVTTTVRIRWEKPDGTKEELYAISLFEIEREGLIKSAVEYWAETYPAPEWRKQWVERY